MAKRNNAAYKEALTHFNRVSGQLKRWHDLDYDQYLEGVNTVKGIDKALQKMRKDAELQDIEKNIQEYEDRYEEALKEADLQDKVEQYNEARSTLEENWGITMDETESDIFWNAFDDPDIIDSFGSDTVLYMGEEIRKDKQVTVKQAAEIAKGVASRAVGSGKDAEGVRNDYNEQLKNYKAMRFNDKGKTIMSHNEAIERLFKK